MTRQLVLVVLSVCLLSGCSGGGNDVAQAPATPAAPVATPNPPVTTDPVVAPPPPPPVAVDNPTGGETTAAPAPKLGVPGPELAFHARGLSIVRPEHFAVIKVDLANARKSKLGQSLPKEVVEAVINNAGAGSNMEELASVAETIDLLWAAVGPPVANGPPDWTASVAFFVRAINPEAITEFLENSALPEGRTIDYKGRQYKSIDEGKVVTYYWHNGAEIVFAMDEAIIKQAIDASGMIVSTPLLKKLAQCKLDADFVVAGSLGPFKQPATEALTGMLQELRLPIPLHLTAGPLPGQIEYATIAIDLDDPQLIDIDADMDSPQAAENFKTSLAGLVGLGNIMLGQFEQQAPDEPSVKEMFATAKKVLAAVKVENDDKHIVASLVHLPELDKLPEVLAAAGSAKPKVDELSNARTIAIAAHTHRDATRRWPANLKDGDGNDVLSWRVALLPFAEEKLLYDQVDRKAAWDSDANRELLDIEMYAYKTSASDDARMTSWKMLPEVQGGIMFLSTGEGTEVPWAQPDNFVIDPANPAEALGPEPKGGYVVVMSDGSVMRMPQEDLIDALGQDASPAPTDAPQPRTWTDASGKFKIEATLVGVADGKATLKRSDNGQEITIPIDKLSAADQEHLKSLE